MPLYEYECQECGCRMEIIQRSGQRPVRKLECDDCGQVRPVKKLLSAPAFQFKGEGWYVTDYADKKGGKKSDAKAESGSSESSAGSGDGGNDSSASKDGGDKAKSSTQPQDQSGTGSKPKAAKGSKKA